MIGDLAAGFGAATSALRCYERRGLLASTARVGGRRTYDIAAAHRRRADPAAERQGPARADPPMSCRPSAGAVSTRPAGG
ncbi:MAG: MerR family DNA-binding transcriptional regulator [Actinomycetes bacterium]